MADKEWTLDFADVELEDNTFTVNSHIDFKDLEKYYKDLMKGLSKDSVNILKDLFAKKRSKEEKVKDKSIKNELIGFFDKIAAREDAYTDKDMGDDIENKFDIRIEEQIDIKLKNDGEVNESSISGTILVVNKGTRNRIWDIDLLFSDTENTDLKEKKFHILDLDPQEEWPLDYKVDAKEIEAPLKIIEDIDVTPDKEEKSRTFVLDQEHEPLFAITVENTSESVISNIEVIKTTPEIFRDTKIKSEGVGKADKKSEEILWKIDELEVGQSTTLEFTTKITPDGSEPINSGQIVVNYSLPASTYSGIDVEHVDGYSDNIYYVDRDERDEEPDVWDCKFIFKNKSEFPLKLLDVDLRAGDFNTEEKVVDLGPELDPDVIVSPGGEWISKSWEIKSEDVPVFGRNVEFTVVGDVINSLSATVTIEPALMSVLTLTGTKEFSQTEIQSYRETELEALTTVTTSGRAPVDKFHIEDEIPRHFEVPDTEQVKITVNGKELDSGRMTFSFDPSEDPESQRKMIIEVEEVLDQVGVLEDESTIKIEYPIKAVNPVEGEEVQAGILFQAITQDGSEIELLIESPKEEIVVVHIRRRTTEGRVIQQGSTKGQYTVILIHKNRGDAPEVKKVFEELIPDNFKLVSANPDAKESGNKLTWTFDSIEPDQESEIEFTIEGSGDYRARDAQISYKG